MHTTIVIKYTLDVSKATGAILKPFTLEMNVKKFFREVPYMPRVKKSTSSIIYTEFVSYIIHHILVNFIEININAFVNFLDIHCPRKVRKRPLTSK